MRRHLPLIVFGLLTTACADRNAPSTQLFSQLIKTAIGGQNWQCVAFLKPNPDTPGHLNVFLPGTQNEDFFRGYRALAKQGWIKISLGTFTTTDPLLGKQSQPNAVFVDLTPVGQQFLAQRQGRVCYGRAVFDRLVNYTEPAEAFGVKRSIATYTWHLADIPGWARDKDIGEVLQFGYLVQDVPRQRKVGLTLYNTGWKVEGKLP